MILILSQNHIEEPTNNVIDWLHYYNANFKRINGEEFAPTKEFTLNINNSKLEVNKNDELNIDTISSVWYRRWTRPMIKSTNFEDYLKCNFKNEEVLLIECYESFLTNELSAYTNGIFSLLNAKKWMPKVQFIRGKLNKLDVLLRAKKIGLEIPNTIITSSKTELIKFLKINQSLITKPIYEVSPIIYKDFTSSMYTKLINEKDIEKFPNQFYPSLFQKEIEKAFEIRVFIFKKKIFSMAIFSQNDSKTNIDFRNYNFENPNRNVPFNLPIDIEKKLFNLFKDLNLNTGSVDFIMSKNNEIVFLEINPVGQLGMVSIGGNYNIEKIIAKELIKIDKRHELNRKCN